MPVGNVPKRLSSFIGREDELRCVHRLLDEGHRLVTLVGPGGAGKTRLALQVAAGVEASLDWSYALLEDAQINVGPRAASTG